MARCSPEASARHVAPPGLLGRLPAPDPLALASSRFSATNFGATRAILRDPYRRFQQSGSWLPQKSPLISFHKRGIASSSLAFGTNNLKAFYRR
jgi:hypothetical protein